MAKRDKLKTAKRARDQYEWAVDSPPCKSQKKQKVKERQAGKKEIESHRGGNGFPYEDYDD